MSRPLPMAVDGNPGNVKWVMVVNLNPGSISGGSGGQYFIGDFDGTTFTSDDPATYTPPAGTVIQDFENATFGSWTTTGNAFGPGPATGGIDGQQAVTGFEGRQLANSFHNGDGTVGTLTSQDFTVNQPYLNFLIGGGNHPNVPGTQLSNEPPAGTLLFDGFELPNGTNLEEAGWTLTGDFVPDLNPSTSGGEGAIGAKRLNTWEGGPLGDDNRGTLSSPSFTITDDYLNFLVGGGGRSDGSLEAELLVDGEIVKTATGSNDGILNWKSFDVRAYRGKEAVLRINDQATGGWGHLTFDHPVISPAAALPRSVETTVNLIVDGRIVRSSHRLQHRDIGLGGLDTSATCRVSEPTSRSSTTTTVVGDTCWLINSPSRTLRHSQPPNALVGWTTAATSTPASRSTTSPRGSAS